MLLEQHRNIKDPDVTTLVLGNESKKTITLQLKKTKVPIIALH